MNDERTNPNDGPAEEGPPVTRFFLTEPAPTVPADTYESEAYAGLVAHSFRLALAPAGPGDGDLFTGRAVAPGRPVPTLFFQMDVDDPDDPDDGFEMDEPVPGVPMGTDADGLRTAARLALPGVEAEVWQAANVLDGVLWRRAVLRALVASEPVGPDGAQP